METPSTVLRSAHITTLLPHFPYDGESLIGTPPLLQVLIVSDPALLPTMFDGAERPPNVSLLDGPVQEFMVRVDTVKYYLVTSKEQYLHACCKDVPSEAPQCHSWACLLSSTRCICS